MSRSSNIERTYYEYGYFSDTNCNKPEEFYDELKFVRKMNGHWIDIFHKKSKAKYNKIRDREAAKKWGFI